MQFSSFLVALVLCFQCIALGAAESSPPQAPPGWRMVDRFYGFRFEIHGNVQGVWFRKSTQEKADELACFGWVQNTAANTVVGEARCGKRAGPQLQQWLEHGPSSASVSRADFKVYKDTKIKLHFSDFAILDDERSTCFRDDGPHSCSKMGQASSSSSSSSGTHHADEL